MQIQGTYEQNEYSKLEYNFLLFYTDRERFFSVRKQARTGRRVGRFSRKVGPTKKA
jgi:hypothetical protein